MSEINSRKSMEQFAFNHKGKRAEKSRKSKPVQCKVDRRRNHPSEFVLHCIAIDSQARMQSWVAGKKEKR